MREYYQPIAKQLITNPSAKGRHELSPYETPFAKNMILEGGVARKRFGISTVYDWDTGDKILGFYKANSSYALIVVYDNSAGYTKIFEWNLDVNSPTMTDISTAVDATLDATAWWHFTKHYDTSSKGSGTSNQGVIVCTNGVNDVLVYDPNATAGSKLSVMISASDSTAVRGTFTQSRNGVLYLANIWEYPFGASNYLQHQVTHCFLDDITNWTNRAVESRPESSSFITGLIRAKNGLILAKTDELWYITPYLNFSNISEGNPENETRGLSSPFGYMTTADNVFINNQKKIESITGEWLSYPIHNLLGGAGLIGDITAAHDSYARNQHWATANYIFSFSEQHRTWNHWEYGEDVRLLSNMSSYDKIITQWIGDLSLHTAMTIGEEQITPDYLVAYNDKTLAVMNHFNRDQLGSDSKIESIYQTPWVNLNTNPSRVDRVQKVVVFGTPDTTWDVWQANSSYPTRTEPTYTKLNGSASINSEGIGHIDIDTVNSYHSIQLVNNSMVASDITGLLYQFEPRESLV